MKWREVIVIVMILLLLGIASATNYTILRKYYCYDNMTLGENTTVIENGNMSVNQTLIYCPFGCENGYCKDNPIDVYLYYIFICILFITIVIALVRYIRR